MCSEFSDVAEFKKVKSGGNSARWLTQVDSFAPQKKWGLHFIVVYRLYTELTRSLIVVRRLSHFSRG